MSPEAADADYEPSPWEPIRDHVAQYLATDGAEGAEWNGATCVILTSTGAKTGKIRRTPLIRVKDGDRYLIVASMGGAPDNPKWFANVVANPDVTIQDRADVHELRARVATPAEKAELWPLAVEQWPDYDQYQSSTDRDIPVVILEPR